MDRYYFNVRFDDAYERDRFGHDFPNLDDAIAEARRTRIDLMTELGLDDLQIEIADRSGPTLAKVPQTRR
jgi:hypothetical protein